ncbi:MAG: GNAT family N-acetyltransferase [Oscillospiraceae bacterium]
METTIIDIGNYKFFNEMLLPEAYARLEEGTPIFALGLVDEGIACGALAGRPKGSVFQLTSFFVAQSYRQKGGAKILLESLIDCMKGQGDLQEIDASFTMFTDDHRLFEGFLEHSGFVYEKERSPIISVALGALASNPFYLEEPETRKVRHFSELPESCLRELDKAMRVADGAPLAQPLDKAEIDKELSVAIMDGNRITSFLLFDHSFAGMLTLAFADPGHKDGAAEFAAMLRGAYQTAVKRYPPEAKIVIQPVNSFSSALVQKLAEGYEVVSKTASLSLN